jgi:CheW-like protein
VSGDALAELRALLSHLGQQNETSAEIELRHLRSLLVFLVSAQAGRPRDRVAESLRILDEVLDSPLDVDSSVLELLRSTLESEPRPSPLKSARTAKLASHMRRTSRTLQEQAQRVHLGLEALKKGQTDREPVAKRRPAQAPSGSIAPDQPAPIPRRLIRGLHVRQGGHDFVIPVDNIDRALSVDVSQLPTVHGRPVAHVSGEMCDVIHLAGHLGLLARSDSSPGTLIAISESGKRVCLAIDKVVGPVETTVTPLECILPDVTSIVEVASLESGGLALVPDFSRLIR